MKQKFLQTIFLFLFLGVIYLGSSSYSNNNASKMSSNSTVGCGGGGCHSTLSNARCNITVTGFPDSTTYVPGQVYPVTINVKGSAPSTKVGINFSVTGGTISGLGPMGALTLVNSTSARHTTPSSFAVSGANRVFNYTFNWTAPSSTSGNIVLFASANAVDGNNTTSGDFYGTYKSNNAPFSLDYLSFTTQTKANEVSLNWVTNREDNIDYFSLERSNDGINFFEVEKFNALGDINNGRIYSGKDYPKYSDDYYYRLKIVSNAGDFTFGPTKLVSFNNGAKFEAISFPNPVMAGNAVHLNVFNNKSEKVEVFVMDTRGILISKETYDANKGTNYLHIASSVFRRPGMYYIEVRPSTGGKISLKHLAN